MSAEGGVIGIGSGGFYAMSAARALVKVDGLELEDIATRSMDVASEICVYTNNNYPIESVTLPDPDEPVEPKDDAGTAENSDSDDKAV